MDIQEYIEQEQVHINMCIEQELDTLHSHIRPVAQHIFSTGGKRLRPLLILLIARHFGYTSHDIYSLAIAVEFIHSATLLHDDILDNSSTRRGKQTAHLIFGTQQTVLAGDALLAKGCHLVACAGIPELISKVSEIIMDTVEGEIEEISCEAQLISFEQYIEIIRGKTAKMIQKACEMGAIRANASREEIALLGCFGEHFGMAFQIVDDILDYTGTSTFGKPRGIDIREGKITAPLLLYAQSISHGEELLKNIIEKKYSLAVLEELIIDISNSNAIDKAYQLVQEYVDVALEALAKLHATHEVILLQKMTEYSIKRTL